MTNIAESGQVTDVITSESRSNIEKYRKRIAKTNLYSVLYKNKPIYTGHTTKNDALIKKVDSAMEAFLAAVSGISAVSSHLKDEQRQEAVQAVLSALGVTPSAAGKASSSSLVPESADQHAPSLAKPIPAVAPALWSDENARAGRKAVRFALDVHGPAIRSGALTRAQLMNLDPKLYDALVSVHRSEKRRQTLPDEIKRLMDGTRSALVERNLASYGIETPDDALRVNADSATVRKLYAAVVRRT